MMFLFMIDLGLVGDDFVMLFGVCRIKGDWEVI